MLYLADVSDTVFLLYLSHELSNILVKVVRSFEESLRRHAGAACLLLADKMTYYQTTPRSCKLCLQQVHWDENWNHSLEDEMFSLNTLLRRTVKSHCYEEG